MINNDIEDFARKVNEVQIPDKLDSTIQQAIKKGGKILKRRRSINNAMMYAAAFVVVFSSFVVSINMAPAFAAQIENLPGGESIVKLLTFNRSTVGGGEITDGKDIQSIEKEPGQVDKDQSGEALQSEVIRIGLGDAEGDAAQLSNYEVTYLEYPYSAVVSMSGVRAFSAAQGLADIEEGPLVRNVYRLVTLDDSAHRFVINLKKPVNIEVREEANPAMLVLTINEKLADKDTPVVFSVRSKSMPFGEEIAIVEEILAYQYESNHARMLQDEDGTYLVEEGYYASEEEAQARIDEINSADPSLKLFIEERSIDQLPKSQVSH